MEIVIETKAPVDTTLKDSIVDTAAVEVEKTKSIDKSIPAPRKTPQLAVLKSSFVRSSAFTVVIIKTEAPPKARRPITENF